MPKHYKGKTGAAKTKALREHKAAMKQKKPAKKTYQKRKT